MTREKAAKWIKYLRDRYSKQAEEYEAQGALIPMDALYPYIQALDLALSALRPVSREQVERIRGEWIEYEHPHIICCTRCDYGTGPKEKTRFCPYCGAPMTGEAVDMMLRRWKEAVDGET